MAKVAVVLAGCGVFDGAEIHESVLTLLALDRAGAQITCAAPFVPQQDVVNHQTHEPARGEKRQVEQEAARIARGRVQDVANLKATDFDALIFPGGFGVAKNLCTWAVDGAQMKINKDVARFIGEMHAAHKPIGAMCIAPVVLAKALGEAGKKPTLTIGRDQQTAQGIEKMGATHQTCDTADIVIDQKNKIVTTPAYMTARSIKEAAAGIEKLVQAVLQLCAK